ncbi:hypothetical protein FACS189445_2730 [Spirochaetia bacterium]|nr:hypothetical protein FACS189445_2730 [Spirochaetia bacterium]
MASINSRYLVLPALLLFLAGAVSAQSGEVPRSSPLATEIGNLEGKLGLSTLSGAERREVYSRLASLHMLSGNIDTAARAWREAALADPENRDETSSLESALCFLTLGEFDAAADALRGSLERSPLEGGRDILRDAQYIAAQIELFRTGSSTALYALLGKTEFQDYRPAIYYTFWRFFSDGAYKTQILSEFPASPEAHILKSEDAAALGNAAGKTTVSALNRPLWFFHPGRGSVTIGPAVPIPQVLGPTLSPVSSAAASSSGGPTALQTGLFSREENTRDMVSRLTARGFKPEIRKKLVNGVTHWVVTIPPGENFNQTILKLKDAGFESFPVF